MLHVGLDSRVVESSSDHSLGVEDRVVRVHGHLVFGGISDETFGVGEGDVARSGTVTLVVGDDFHLAVLEDTHAGVGRSEVNTDSWCLLCHLCSGFASFPSQSKDTTSTSPVGCNKSHMRKTFYNRAYPLESSGRLSRATIAIFLFLK